MRQSKFLVGLLVGMTSTYIFISQNKSPQEIKTLVEPLNKECLPLDPTLKKESPICPCLFSEQILPPPEFQQTMPQTIETNAEGEALVRWKAIAGAKKYSIHVQNEMAQTVKEYSASRTVFYIKDVPLPKGILEANYSIRISTINGKDEEGPLGMARAFHVRPQANVVAPQIQVIEVED